MSFTWPYALSLLLVLPLVVAAYLWLQRRRRRFAVNYATLSLIREALPAQSRWRRRLPFALLLAALACLAIAAARPQAAIAVPLDRTSIILALDVSRSMCATDVAPNRLAVAQEVARTFVKNQDRDTRIGVVAFSGVAQLVVPPTTDRELLVNAIDGFTAGRGTAVGSALLRSVDAIAEINPNVARSGLEVTPVAVGQYVPDIVVLLTDGATTQGINPLRAAEQAAARGVRVYSIGFGGTGSVALSCSREQMGADVFGPNFGWGQAGAPGADGPRRFGLVLDERTLQRVADITGGSYYHATSADELEQVFADLPTDIELQTQQVEVSFGFVGLGATLMTAAWALSLAWNRAL